MELYGYNRRFGKYAFGYAKPDIIGECKKKTSHRMRGSQSKRVEWEIWTSPSKEEIAKGHHAELLEIVQL